MYKFIAMNSVEKFKYANLLMMVILYIISINFAACIMAYISKVEFFNNLDDSLIKTFNA